MKSGSSTGTGTRQSRVQRLWIVGTKEVRGQQFSAEYAKIQVLTEPDRQIRASEPSRGEKIQKSNLKVKNPDIGSYDIPLAASVLR